MSEPIEIHGECAPGFGAVKEAFQKNFDQGLEVGASFAAVHDGKPIVDLWGGYADAACTRPWQRDTIVNVFSTTKAMAALSTLMLVDRGELDLDATVASLWPEFSQNGKQDILVRQILSHTSGLSGWAEQISTDDLFDWDKSTRMLAEQAPFWEPGTQSGYHALTHGFLLGEVVRRVSGRSIGTFFCDEVAEPLGADFHIGLHERHEHRVADMVPPAQSAMSAAARKIKPDTVAARTMGNPPLMGEVANRREWRAAEIPAANGQGNARSVARVASVLACGGSLDGVSLLGADTLAKTIEEQSYSRDLVLGLPIRWGLGFGLTSKDLPIGPNPRSFFWGGWGGSLVVMDLDAKLAFSYVMNKMGASTMGDPRGFGPGMALFAAI